LSISVQPNNRSRRNDHEEPHEKPAANEPVGGGETVTEVLLQFAGLLRGLRTEAGLTQEELAEAAGLTSRAISYLERGDVMTPRRETVRLLADALRLAGPVRARFEAAARGRAAPNGAGADTATATQTLPRDVASFTGRQRELAEIADGAGRSGAVISIHAIGGMAGIGKTAFAVHAGHRLAGQFPGGQVFLPLHGHTPGQQPTEASDALASLLAVIGLPAARIPAGLEARMALWRDCVAGRRLLLILDDAVSSEQVTPLLPGSGGSLVLITSRRHLSALEGAAPISLDTLPPDEAAELLVRLTGRAGLSRHDPAVTDLARLCGYLPLAIGMVARQLRHHPAWTAAGRAAELAATAGRLGLLATENLSVAAAFDLSYAALTSDQQRLFRRLGVHHGAEIDGYAAAALDGTELADARRGLEDLYDQYLLAEPAPGRYRLHDLIREHARDLGSRLDPADERDAATGRLLDYYQHAAARANALIARQTRPVRAQDEVPAVLPPLTGPDQALVWVRDERANLLLCLDHATRGGRPGRILALTAGISGLLERDGPWNDAIRRHVTAIAAAQSLGDRHGQAGALNDLGAVLRLKGDYAAAGRALEQALDIYCALGDRLGQANALQALGTTRRNQSDYQAAAAALEGSLAIYRDIGDRLGQANSLHALGATRHLMDDYPTAAAALRESLAIYRDVGDRLGQANALANLGGVLLATGDYPAASRDLEEALGINRAIGNRLGQATALTNLGTVLRLTGDLAAAGRALEQALATYRAIGSRLGEANTLAGLGALQRLAGDLPASGRALDEALRIYRDIGDRGGEVYALNEKGTLHRAAGEPILAEACHQQALDLARAIDSPVDEARALVGLGRCALAAGHTAEGESRLRQALAIFQQTGTPEAAGLASELEDLTGPD
jgi:tetratricopeptide (TPR) repeat protein/transcriptional regulator with XRE-family HTH domain